jgi:hypothetical protein
VEAVDCGESAKHHHNGDPAIMKRPQSMRVHQGPDAIRKKIMTRISQTGFLAKHCENPAHLSTKQNPHEKHIES